MLEHRNRLGITCGRSQKLQLLLHNNLVGSILMLTFGGSLLEVGTSLEYVIGIQGLHNLTADVLPQHLLYLRESCCRHRSVICGWANR